MLSTRIISTGTGRGWIAALAVASSLAFVSGHVSAQTDQQELVNRAETTFNTFLRDPDMTWLQRHLPDAKGVLIAPQIVKAGFIFGGAGGRAVLFARDAATGRFTGPAFYDIAAASVGFQAGVSVSETVTLIMTEKGLNSLLASTAKIGGDASIAAGPVGSGANADITTDLVAFSRAKGLYGGLNLEGSVIHVSDTFNRAYYGSAVLPPDILINASVHNPQSEHFADALSREASRQRTSSMR